MDQEEPKRELTVREAGKLGGKRCKELHGPEHYTKMGAKGGNATKEKYGDQFYATIGKKGGTANRDRQDPNFYQRIGKKGGDRVKELVELAKRLEAQASDGSDGAKDS